MSKVIAIADHNHDLLRMMFERWNAHDVEYEYGLLADNYREYLNGVLVKNGHADAREADRFLNNTIPDYRAEVDDLYADKHGGALRGGSPPPGPRGHSLCRSHRSTASQTEGSPSAGNTATRQPMPTHWSRCTDLRG
jgi:hypothetical protein